MNNLERYTDDLTLIAATINSEHEQVYAAALDALTHAILCGEALQKAREAVPDGEWTRWVDQNLDITDNQAFRYLRIAHYRDVLLSAEHRPQSVRAALDYLRENNMPRLDTSNRRNGGRYPTFDVDEARRLHSQGMSFGQIGQLLGISSQAVWLQLAPGARDKRAKSRRRRWELNKAQRKALVDAERAKAVARVGGSVADAYALLRKCAIALDRAITTTSTTAEVDALRDALAFTHRAEDQIVAALKLERTERR